MNRFKKVVLTGVLAISPIIGVSAVSAAPANNVSANDLSTITQKYGIDLNSLLNGQGQKGNIDLNSLLKGQEGKWQTIGSDNNNVFAGVIWKHFPNTNFNCDPGQGQGTGDNTGNTDNGSGSVDDGSDNGSGTTDNGTDTGAPEDTGSGTTNNNNGSGTENNGSQETVSDSQSAYANQVVTLVNQERAKAGLPALTSDSKLANMAMDKAKDMYDKNYFDHTSPTYGSPFDMMKQYGISYSYAGENIAKGQRNPEEVMNAWMNSEGHRQNIMSPNFTKIGVAYYNGEWVQEFIAN
ncbi:CAP domain-containing protein [Paenibacillus sp. UNC451MF]|uniref:CAP domain-containing protein n=1 Tax=Paenibacillus sp. UNC451MF TaxID=1449063 RepID=UPI00055FCBA0|nr:CAP domain-containing protein [Paenibacillus sp. UNC451MF]